ncbi:hypothetical protein WJX84_004326 [Apatococcus fuscideae]|uniref:F-box domain-containing protein n=1 Tax=Apatococcus fuscideae TaxID=2026836 RepID=A0AAW1S3W3_9CHLO
MSQSSAKQHRYMEMTCAPTISDPRLQMPLQHFLVSVIPLPTLASLRASCKAMRAVTDQGMGTAWKVSSEGVLAPQKMEVYACGASVQVQLRSQASVLADTLARVAPASSSYVRSKDFVTTPRQSRACILTISTFSLLLGSTTLTFRLRTVPLECRCAPDLPFYRPSWSPSGDCLMVTTVTEYEDQYVHVRAELFSVGGHILRRYDSQEYTRASVVRNPVRHMLRVSPISVHLRAVWLHDGRGLILWVPGKANDSDAVTFRPLPIEF